MERRIGLAVGDAARIVREMLGRVPAAHREVDAADEGHRIVDHHDLLVLAAGKRMRVVVAQVHAPRRRPAEAVERREFPVGAEHHRVVPVEDMHVQRVAPVHQPVEKLAEQRRRPVRLHRVEVQPRLTVEVPREDADRVARAQRRLVERLVVVRRIDERRDALGARHRPAVVARPQERRRVRLDARGRGGAAVTPAPHAAVEVQHAAHFFTVESPPARSRPVSSPRPTQWQAPLAL